MRCMTSIEGLRYFVTTHREKMESSKDILEILDTLVFYCRSHEYQFPRDSIMLPAHLSNSAIVSTFFMLDNLEVINITDFRGNKICVFADKAEAGEAEAGEAKAGEVEAGE